RDIVRKHEVLFLCDATQCYGRHPIMASDVDLMAFSAHKFYGPKGVGGLYIDPSLKLQPLVFGGGHEKQLRSGTLNVPGIVGMGAATKIRDDEMVADYGSIQNLGQRLREGLLAIEDTFLNGGRSRLPSTVNICFRGVDNEA